MTFARLFGKRNTVYICIPFFISNTIYGVIKKVKSSNNLIWIDLEMTGLATASDDIIEIATVITNSNLEILAEGPVFAISQPESKLKAMDSWNQKQHTKSGLYQRVLASNTTMQIAEEETIAFISNYVGKGNSPMAGNSICQDRRFLARQMPALEQWFHYRNLDVSSFKEIAKRWYPESYNSVKKNSSHLALDDIYDSINELKHYRKTMLK